MTREWYLSHGEMRVLTAADPEPTKVGTVIRMPGFDWVFERGPDCWYTTNSTVRHYWSEFMGEPGVSRIRVHVLWDPPTE